MTGRRRRGAAGLRVSLWGLARLSDLGLVLFGGYVTLVFLPNCLLGTGVDACGLLNLAGPGHLLPVLAAGTIAGRVGRAALGSRDPSQE